MKIGIDASRANKDNKTGTEWYSYYVIEELKKIARGQEVELILYTNEELKGDLSKCDNNCSQKILKWPPKYLWTQIRLWWELIINPPDVLFVPAHTIPFLPIPRKIKVCVNVHDVGFKRFPKLYKPIQVWYHDLTMQTIKRRADVIITISEFSKREIIELYNVREEKIKIVYLGYDKEKFVPVENPQALEKYKINQPYLLYIGRIEKKKNIGTMVAAFALAKEKLPELKLVLAGNAGNEIDSIKNIIAEHKLEKEIIMPGYVAEEDLPAVISQASIFLFPTLYEGFGLPILQAMACATPVITSDMDPHREVAGGAAVLADPHDATQIADKIIELITVENFRQQMVKKGLERVKDFSWQKTAQELWQILLK